MSYCHDSYRDSRSIIERTFLEVLMKSFPSSASGQANSGRPEKKKNQKKYFNSVIGSPPLEDSRQALIPIIIDRMSREIN